MKDIWTYNTKKNGLLSNGIEDVVSGPGGIIYAATDKGSSSSKDSGGTWQPEVEGAIADNGEIDICINQRSGVLLFTYMDNRGLGVKSKNAENPNPYYITQEKDGIYSNKVNSVQINESISSDDPLSAVYITHYSGTLFGGEVDDRTISRYNVQSKKWEILQPPEFAGVVQSINTIKFYNETIYVCAEGALAISKDGTTWNVMTGFNVSSRSFKEFGLGSEIISDVLDFYIDPTDTWYLACTYEVPNNIGESYVLISTNHGTTWDYILHSDAVGFTRIEALNNDLFVCSGKALRVFDKKKMSLRLFDSSNGLNLNYEDEALDGPDKFLVQQDKVYIPTNNGIAIANMADVAQYPRIWDYATTEDGLTSNTVLCLSAGRSASGSAVVLAGGDKGLMGSVDGGASWKRIDAVRNTDLKGQQINDIQTSWMINEDYYALATEQIGIVICSNPVTSAAPNELVWHLTTQDGLASNQVQCVYVELGNKQINGCLGHNAVYDVWYDPTTSELYGLFSEGTNSMILLMKSIDNGKTWFLVIPSMRALDIAVVGCNPKLFSVNRRLFIATNNVLNICDLELKELGYAYWADGLQGNNTGAISVDKNGQIYAGTNGLGAALSNVAYIPLYDYYG
ncbi:MAG: hypothetical protein QM652_02250 [Legionella sp.]|uniref:hypothetical protein n=1 Tax=Legionella sp. TaxID=459 RepID=UPI0039E5F5A3